MSARTRQPTRPSRITRLVALVTSLVALGQAGCGSNGSSGGAGTKAVDGGPAGGTRGSAGRPAEAGGAGMGGDAGGGGAPGGKAGAGGTPGRGGTAGLGGTSGGSELLVADCFKQISGGVTIDYDRFGPAVGSHCLGTNHQDIRDIERIVFLGDSVTEGTPPSSILSKHFRALLGGAEVNDFYLGKGTLHQRFADAKVANCAKWGARTDDLLEGGKQIPLCWPELFEGDKPKPASVMADPRRTLVIFTMGGNDIFKWAEDSLRGQDALDASEQAAQLLEDAIAFFRAPGRFPNGVHVIYGNPYEYTDATGDTGSCTPSNLIGLGGNQLELAPAVTHFTERYMEVAVEYQVDMMFMLEHFCGHGFHHEDMQSQCYRGPGAELWFDLTCIHPNDAGHAQIARMVEAIVDE